MLPALWAELMENLGVKNDDTGKNTVATYVSTLYINCMQLISYSFYSFINNLKLFESCVRLDLQQVQKSHHSQQMKLILRYMLLVMYPLH